MQDFGKEKGGGSGLLLSTKTRRIRAHACDVFPLFAMEAIGP